MVKIRDGKKAQARRVYLKPETYGPGIPEARWVWAGYGLKNGKKSGTGTDMGFSDTRPIPGPFTRIIPEINIL
ncbi:hypothetical protein HanIR_Chr17g0877541 [Helianthus annuus]|nr:hypothetical protein HanIR_Chr17g0877541 [Helianthus annuus]